MIETEELTQASCEVNASLADLLERVSRRLEAGEVVDLQSIRRECPEYGDELEGLLPILRQMIHLAQVPDSSSPGSENDSLLKGSLGDFEILDVLGRGGMGVVYRARQKLLGRDVAVKVLPLAALADSRRLTRFHNEVRATAALHHPHIVSVYTVGVERGIHYYAMQLVDGPDLSRIVTALREADADGKPSTDSTPQETLAIKETRQNCTATTQAIVSQRSSFREEYYRSVARWGQQVAEGLAYAHQFGVVHRDIKPSNLLVDDQGNILITDFGLARLAESNSITRTGDRAGTLRYMSPEYASRQYWDDQTDVYSLGATLYELLLLRPPFPQKDEHSLLRSIVEQEPPALCRIDTTIPMDLQTIVQKAMEKEPADRYRSATALADDLGRFLKNEPIEAMSPTIMQRAAKWLRKHVAIAYVTMGALLALTIVLTTGITLVNRSRSEAVQQRGVADEAARVAEEQKRLANRQRDISLRNNYVASIRLAQKDWGEGNLSRMSETLKQFVPRDTLPDLRGWEWYYLKSRLLDDRNALNPELGPVSQVAWNSDGTLLAAAGGKGVKIFDSTSRQVLQYLPGWRDFDWQPGGSYLAGLTRGEPHRVTIWDPTTGREKASTEIENVPIHSREWRDDSAEITRIKWKPDGGQIAWAQAYKLSLWNYAEDTIYEYEYDSKDGTFGFAWLSWQPDGKTLQLIDGSPGFTVNWHVESETFSEGQIGRRYRIEYSHQRHSPILASSSYGDVYAAGYGKLTTVMQGHRSSVQALAWSPDDKYLATGGSDNLVRIWLPGSAASVNCMAGHFAAITSVDWSPSAEQVVSSSEDGTIRFWDFFEIPEATTIPGGHGILSPSGELLVVSRGLATEGEPSYQYQIVELKTGHLVRKLEGQRRAPRLHSWSPDQQFIAASDGGTRLYSGAIGIWDANNGKLRCSLPNAHTGPVFCVSWSPDSRQFASCGWDKLVKIWNTATGELVRTFEKHSASVGSALWSPDGNWFASVDEEYNTNIWDATSWSLVWSLGPTKPLSRSKAFSAYELAWHPESNRLAVQSGPGRLAVWSIRLDGPPEIDWSSDTGNLPIRGIAWSPNGERIATFGEEGFAKIWDSDDGRELLAIDVGKGGAKISWHPDGERLITSDFGSAVRIWDASPAMRTRKQPSIAKADGAAH